MKKFSIISYVIFILLGAIFLYTQKDILVNVLGVGLHLILALSFLHICRLLLNSVFLVQAMKIYGKKISFVKAFKLSVRTSTLNLILPFLASLGYRAHYLKKLHNLPYSVFSAITAASYLLTLFSSSLFALITYLVLRSSSYSSLVLLILISLTVSFLILLSLPISYALKRFNLPKRVQSVLESWDGIKSEPRIYLIFFPIYFLSMLAGGILVYFQLQVVGVTVGLLDSIYMQLFSSVSRLLSIIPGGVGTVELSQAFAALTIQVDPELVLLGSIISRIILVLTLLIIELGSVLSASLFSFQRLQK